MTRSLALGGFWFVYFAGLGVFFPFFSLYLGENAGLDGRQIGLVQAVFPLVAILTQPLWGQAADLTGERRRILIVVTLGAAAGYLVLGRLEGFLPLLLGTAALAAFAGSVVPVATAVSLQALPGVGGDGFGRVRVWGTLGFLAAVALFPMGLRARSADLVPVAGVSEPALGLMFVCAGLLALVATGIALALPRAATVGRTASRADLGRLVRERPVVRLLVLAAAAFFALQGPIVLFPLFVRAIGGDVSMVGRMWIVMLLLEVPLILLTGRGLRRLGPRFLIATGILAGGARLVLCAVIGDVRWLYPVQLLHGVSVAGLLVGGPLYMERAAPPRLRATAQALFSMCGVGLGGIVSNAMAGWLVDVHGIRTVYLLGGALGVGLGLLVPWWLPARPGAKRGAPGSVLPGPA